MRILPPLVLALMLLPNLGSGLDLEGPPSPLVYGATVTLETDAASGTLKLFSPAPTVACEELVASVDAAPYGLFPDIPLDHAGHWRLEHEGDGLTSSTSFFVHPAALRVLATPIGPVGSPVTAYRVQIARAEDQSAVPFAHADLLFGNEFVRHYRSDQLGRFEFPHEHLPYVGSYALRAYRDLDVPIQEYGGPLGSLDETCFPGDPVDVPELYGVGPEVGAGSDAILHAANPLVLRIDSGAPQVRGAPGRAEISVRGLDGSPAFPSRVQLLSDGLPRSPSELGLAVSFGSGRIVLDGDWQSSSDVLVRAFVDLNADGVAEHEGEIRMPIEAAPPIRIERVPVNATLGYSVPPRQPDGRPGEHVFRLRFVDTRDGTWAEPPFLAPENVHVGGDVLSTQGVEFDAAARCWIIRATPRAGGATYTVEAQWPERGTVRLFVQVPRDAGARAQPLATNVPLVVDTRGEARVQVQRFNNEFSTFENVVDAHVRLLWADTGLDVRDNSGLAYEYDPGRPAGAYNTQQVNGTYIFRNLQLDRGGPLVAVAEVNVQGRPRFAYAEFQVAPIPLILPEILPSQALAGSYTRFQLLGGPAFNATTFDGFDVRIMGPDGSLVTDQGSFSFDGEHVYWNAALPAGNYTFDVRERLDPGAQRWARWGTASPGRLTVEPADVRLSYADGAPARAHLHLLGGGLAPLARIRVETRLPSGVSGFLTVNATDSTGPIALFAYASAQDPVAIGAPTFFPPEEGSQIGREGRSFYLVEVDEVRSFSSSLTFRADRGPIDFYAWPVGPGHVRLSFTPISSSMDLEEPVPASIQVVPPRVTVVAVDTPRGTVAGPPALGLAEPNVVRLRLDDPTGRHRLDNVSVVLRDDAQAGVTRAQALGLAAPDGAALATLGFVPDATGTHAVWAGREPMLLDTGVRLPVRPPSEVPVLAVPLVVYADLPGRVTEEATFEVRVATSKEPFPQGVVVEAFGRNTTLISGVGQLRAPEVNETQISRATIRVLGAGPVHRNITVVPREASDSGPGAGLEIDAPESAQANQTVILLVSSHGIPISGVAVSIGGEHVGSTNAQGELQWVAPNATALTTMDFAFQKAGFAPGKHTIQIHPRAEQPPQGPVIDLPTAIATADAPLTIRVKIPVGTDANGLRLTIGSDRVPYRIDGDIAYGTWRPPHLIEDTQVFVVARLPGMEPVRTLLTIQKVNP